ncbi:hypothetical protein BC829DRAFT_398951 [Chytridium lagenaria]|nr:hypothetical protein BC829DRAFT_398951 [Chytridium lagenaria]
MFNFITDSDAIDNDLSKVFAESKRKEIVKPMTSSTEADEAKEDAMQGIEMEEEPKDEELNDSEKAERTIFIGNLPLSVAEKKPVLKELKKLLLEHGKLESIRFRSIAFANPIPKRAAFITKKFHPQRDSMNAYAVFVEKESVQKALVLNGTVFEGKHLRVDSVAAEKTIASSDVKRSIFIGNLRFDISDEALWEFFGKVGDIENVRVVRDKYYFIAYVQIFIDSRFTNVGKGFAYVQFKERESVSLALELHESEIAGRKMRIRRCAKPTTLVKLEGQRSKV